MSTSYRRILTGDRPTGSLHLGHLAGSLKSRVALQHDHDLIVLIADLHSLTTRRTAADIEAMRSHTREMVLDQLAAGLLPERVTFCLQSAVPEIYELNTLLQNLVTVSRLQRMPSLKEMSANAQLDEGSLPYGLLGYPVLQAADILLVRATLVPVGPDNLPHVELTREVVRRFHQLYGEVFPDPEPLVGVPVSVPGLNNRGKMSKSAGNALLLSDDPATVARKIRGAYTDPARVRADIPGEVEHNPVFVYHRLFNDDPAEVVELTQRYRQGRVGDGEVKARLVAALERLLQPMRARRARYAERPALVDELLGSGTERARQLAAETMRAVREAMGLHRGLRLAHTPGVGLSVTSGAAVMGTPGSSSNR
jgi:tryptophanyl-tRNA synthetase